MEALEFVLLSAILASLGVSLFNILKKKKKPKRLWVRPWLKRRDDPLQQTIGTLYRELLIDGDVTEFRKTLRMTPETYGVLLNLLKRDLSKEHTNFRAPVSATTRLAVTLRFLALGDGFRSISQQFCLGLSTTRKIVRETCQIIYKTLQPKYLATPMTTHDWLAEASQFQNRWNFPHCLGSMDGKHIRIVQPFHSGSYYFNYKGYFSIVLLAIVNADYRFLYLDIGAEGKASDGGIWQTCTFNQYLTDPANPLQIPDPQEITAIEKTIPFFLVGDDAFKLGKHIMKPYKGTVTRREHIFNYRLSRARRIAENAFGILTCRFRVLHRTLEVQPEFVEDIVLACCVLHNFLRVEASSEYLQNMALDVELPTGEVLPGAWREENGLDSMRKNSQKKPPDYAKKIRNYMADYFLTEDGELPWQYRVTLE